MKKFITMLIALLAFCFILTACGDNTTASDQNPAPENELSTFTGVSFNDVTLVYDGNEHEILISGSIPANAKVEYTYNKATNAGVYNATAVISADGYQTLTLSANLSILKATFEGIDFSNQKYIKSGREHEILISSKEALPEGTQVSYNNNKGSEKGIYNATATISNPNYETLILNAVMTIYEPFEVPVNALLSLISRPDSWDFLPDAFSLKNMAVTDAPITKEAFADNFVSVSSINKKIIGNQLNVLYTTINQSEKILNKANALFDTANTIIELYQMFVNENPENYANFTGETAGFTFTLTLNNNESSFNAVNGTVTITLTYNSETDTRTGYIKLTDGAAVRYECNQNALHIAYKATVKDVGYLAKLSFERNEDVTMGYMYEYIGSETKALKTSAKIVIDEDYTRIISDKRESDDLLISGYQEVYKNSTGEFIGAEVAETVSKVNFDTLWFNLYDIAGIENIKILDAEHDLNADTIYINNSSNIFTAKKLFSRRYDIEMKDVYYIVAKESENNIIYEIVSAQVPMLFVQLNNFEDLSEDMTDENPNTFDQPPAVNPEYATAVTKSFSALLEEFKELKETNSYKNIESYIDGLKQAVDY